MLRILLGLVFAATFIPGSLLADGGGIGISVQIRILTEDDFQEHVAGHRLEDRDGNWSIGYPNYRLTGEYDGLKLTGRWNWRGKL